MCAATSGSTHSGRNAALRPLNSEKNRSRLRFLPLLYLHAFGYARACACMHAHIHAHICMRARLACCTCMHLRMHVHVHVHTLPRCPQYFLRCVCACVGITHDRLHSVNIFGSSLTPHLCKTFLFPIFTMHAAMKSVKAMKMAKKRAAVSRCNEVRAPAMKKDLPPSFYKIQGFILNSLRTSE